MKSLLHCGPAGNLLLRAQRLLAAAAMIGWQGYPQAEKVNDYKGAVPIFDPECTATGRCHNQLAYLAVAAVTKMTAAGSEN